MAQVANTFETYDAVGNREELADKIYQITPEETPFVSLIGRKSVSSTHPEWQTDTLASPDTDNNQPEGNDWSFQAITPTTRVGNYTQISDKRIIISRTQDKTSKAGRKSELAREVAKKGVELRTDMEVILLSNQASTAGTGNGATNRKAGALRAWLSTNDTMGSGGSSGGFNSSTGVVDAATNGTQRAFTKAILDSTILSTYNAGGNPTVFMCSPYVKTVYSTFMSDSNVVPLRKPLQGNNQATIVAAADMYLSDFGMISIVPNRQMARAGATIARNGFLLDPKMVGLGVFDDISIEKPAKTGDAEKRVLVTEYTLLVNNEAAHGVAADLFGMTASS
ncbi:DUF5309 domain-containing protein [Pelagibacterium flavum]|uniref:DUF5309 domain-containing protein n=1 Tax=Pelagibacterium flavum TaxID=2984530 RepID=A0ABY6IK76_9HYPH|nr:DUF5309 domain-containing protein [Pelagibacterium sp. YIM 151497]UYQ70973.1 DUF5309 domain-containing protein [Pelagibacterium sp. YIM 151497]